MSVVYKNKSDLIVIVEKELYKEDLCHIFSSMKQGCVFVVNDFGQLLGYIDDKSFKSNFYNRLNYSLFEKVYVCYNGNIDNCELLKTKEEADCPIPVTDSNGFLFGAFVYSYPEELISFDRLMNQMALNALPAFLDVFLEYVSRLGYDKIRLSSGVEDYEYITKFIGNRFKVNHYDRYEIDDDTTSTLLIDLDYSKSYRKEIFSKWKNAAIESLDVLLAAALVDTVCGYVRSRNAKLIFIEGPIKEKLDDALVRWPSLFDNLSLSSIMKNDDVICDFCLSDKDLINWMRNPEFGVLGGPRVTTNGVHLMVADYMGNGCKCIGGNRIVSGSEQKNKTIHMYGPCLTYGACVPDQYTIQTYLKNLLTSYGKDFNINNRGVKNGHSNLNDFLYILNTKISDGDVLVVLNSFEDKVIKEISKYQLIVYNSSQYINEHYKEGMKFLVVCKV